MISTCALLLVVGIFMPGDLGLDSSLSPNAGCGRGLVFERSKQSTVIN